MNTNERREQILKDLKEADAPINATALAKRYGVSRQIVVGDIAILKAHQNPIVASVKGYVYVNSDEDHYYTIACKHKAEDTREELYIMVDHGAIVENVIVDLPLYGELVGKLEIASRYDVDLFIEQMQLHNAKNLSEMNEGVHLHTIKCNDEEMLKRIKDKLKEGGYLYE